MAAARQGLAVRLDRAPQRGAAFALTRASRRARTRSIGSRSRARGSSLIFDHRPAVARPPSPGPDPGRHAHRGHPVAADRAAREPVGRSRGEADQRSEAGPPAARGVRGFRASKSNQRETTSGNRTNYGLNPYRRSCSKAPNGGCNGRFPQPRLNPTYDARAKHGGGSRSHSVAAPATKTAVTSRDARVDLSRAQIWLRLSQMGCRTTRRRRRVLPSPVAALMLLSALLRPLRAVVRECGASCPSQGRAQPASGSPVLPITFEPLDRLGRQIVWGHSPRRLSRKWDGRSGRLAQDKAN